MKKALSIIFLFFLILLITAFSQAMFSPSLEDFPQKKIELGQRTLRVAVADTPDLKRKGLREVEDLGELDGMLFVYSEPVQKGFIMKNVLIPLKIGFYSAQGELVSKRKMEPCSQSCEAYRAGKEYQYALEVPLNSKINLNSKLLTND